MRPHFHGPTPPIQGPHVPAEAFPPGQAPSPDRRRAAEPKPGLFRGMHTPPNGGTGRRPSA